MYEQIDLKGRQPEELAERSMIDDILLELNDTSQFSIEIIDFNNYPNRHDNFRYYYNMEQVGEVVVYRVNPVFPISDDYFSMFSFRPTETRYKIHRYPSRLVVKFTGSVSENYIVTENSQRYHSAHQLCKEVYERLLQYIGPDVIQSQHWNSDFQIDFLISEYKVINKDL